MGEAPAAAPATAAAVREAAGQEATAQFRETKDGSIELTLIRAACAHVNVLQLRGPQRAATRRRGAHGQRRVTGWALDCQIVDWLVPAGAWSRQGTPIDAINDIATAAGGYVQPHATQPALRVLPRYPAASWA